LIPHGEASSKSPYKFNWAAKTLLLQLAFGSHLQDVGSVLTNHDTGHHGIFPMVTPGMMEPSAIRNLPIPYTLK
jgi:hypothetical protein